MKKEDIRVSVTGDVLSIEGERKAEEEVKEGGLLLLRTRLWKILPGDLAARRCSEGENRI